MNDKCLYKDVCSLCSDNTVCNNDCIRYFKMKTLIESSLLTLDSVQKVKLVADDVDENAYTTLASVRDDIENVVKQGRNLLIFSKITGNGKTEWMKKLMLNYFDAIWHKCDMESHVLFISVPRFCNALRENISNKSDYITTIQENIFKADLVIWDEIGVKSPTNFEHDYLFSYITERIATKKANFFTSNLDEAEMLESLGDRLYSRIVNNSKVIEFKGRDKRPLNKW